MSEHIQWHIKVIQTDPSKQMEQLWNEVFEMKMGINVK
jgi:hypothetical protein